MMDRFAIVGLSCLFPGASSPERFWENLVAGVDSRGPAGQDVLDHVDPLSTDPEHRITWTSGGWVRDDPSSRALDGLMLSPAVLAGLDRVYRWTLYVSQQVIWDAMLDRSALARTGLVMGNYSFPTATSSAVSVPRLHADVLAGLSDAGVPTLPSAEPAVASRQDLGVSGLPIRFAAQALGLGGPQLALDAACASALYALQLSCSYLSTGQADVMLAGGICAPDPALIHLAFSDLRAYPSNGVSQPFESTSTGITTGQGAGLMAVKRLADAVRDGDQIHAVVDGIGLSADGSGRHLLAPNPSGQRRAYAAAYAAAGVRPADIDYIECHATGTALGDQTELSSLAELHAGNSNPPLLGSVKGNVGHLLTVAGFTSLLKAVLAMRHGHIPPTIGVSDPLASPDGTVGAAQIVREGVPWPDRAGVRRAAVSAFGFGGTNAHVLLSAAPEAHTVADLSAPPLAKPPAASIVGMGAHFGGLSTLDAVERALYDTASDSRPLPERRWFGLTGGSGLTAPAGAYVEQIEVDAIRYQIPPNELAQFNPQHLLMLRVAEEALVDSGLVPVESGIGRGGKEERRIAVLIAMEMDPRTHAHRARLDIHQALDRAVGESDPGYDRAELHAAARESVHQPISPNEVLSYIGNIVASRISARWNFTGPSFTVSGDTAGGAQAIELAVRLLDDPSVEAVLVGAVDLAAGMETVSAAMAAGGLSGHWQPGDGAAALVLRRTADLDDQDRRYAELAAVALSYPDGAALGGRPFAASSHAVADAARQAFARCELQPSDVELVRAHLPGQLERDEAELAGLAEVYVESGSDLPEVAIGTASATVGDVGHAATLAGVVTAALALSNGYVPGMPKPAGLVGPAGSAFYTPERSRPWLRRDLRRPRVAAVSVLGDTGTAAHLLLSARTTSGERRPVAWQLGGPLLLTVPAPDAATLLLRLRDQLDLLEQGADPLALCRAGAAADSVGGLRAVIVGTDGAALSRELSRLAEALPALTSGEPGAAREWSTPSGTYLSLDPIGPSGKLALVYPGAFTAYLGLGTDLFRLFPGLVADVEQTADEPARTFRQDVLWPRSRTPLTSRQLMEREQALLADIPSMLAIGTSFAIAGTDVLRDRLGLTAHGALGYSLGESSMLFALNAWQRGSRSERRLSETPVFQDRLCGPRRTVREAWRLPEETPDAAVWASQVLLCDAERVRQQLTGYDRLWLTHVNTANEVVVAGSPDQLHQLVESLGCPAARPPAEHVMHCSAVDPELAELAELNRYPTSDPGAVELFTAGGYRSLGRLDSDQLADNIAGTLRSCIDFPRLVEQAYAEGYRYFVEVGPAATCTRWAGETLKGRSHVAVSLDRRGQRLGGGVATVLARLVSHGVAVDLSALLGPEPQPAARSLARRVELGGGSGQQSMLAAVRRLAPATSAVLDAPPFQPVTGAGPSSVPSSMETRSAMSASPIRPVAKLSSPEPVAVAEQRSVVGALAARPLPPLSASMIDFRDAPADPHLVAALTRSLAAPPTTPAAAAPARPEPAGVIWNEAQLLEFATGSIAAVFGPGFAEVDAMSRRVRLPEPPYLFVTRVTDLQATTGKFTESKITTEYDVPSDAWYSLDGMVPAAVSIEAGQCDLLLISYLGIDFRNQGFRVYRLLDSTLAFHGDLPTAGQTLRYEISINRFVDTGETMMFFFSYLCYADDELILELKDACAGFFSDAELDNSLGVVPSVLDKRRLVEMTPTTFKPLLRTAKRSLTHLDVELLAAGRVGEVFGPDYDQHGLNPSLRLPDARLRMIDEITEIDPLGGPRRIGRLSALKRLDPDGWYFRCHFTGDPVMPGSLVAEGGVQILQAYALSLGLQMCLPDARFQTVPGLETKVRVRGQITPATTMIRYEVHVIELTLLPRPTVIADITVYDGDRAIISMQNFGVQVREKPGTPYRPELGGLAADFGRRNRDGEPAIINELHLAHAAKGNLATAMGPEFEIYDNRHAPYIPNGDFQFVDRIMALTGERGVLKPGATMLTEYDSPADAWYYLDNSAELAPNCLLMETSLQAAILLGYYLGATLAEPEHEFGIRNLDGKATWLRHVDLRGKTIRHSSRMLSSTSFAGTVLQNFEYELSCDGSVFYVGQSLFGYFTEEGLANQLGMDNGVDKPTWLALNPQPVGTVRHIELADDPSYYLDATGGDLHLPDGQLRLLDSVDLVAGGGTFGAGYLHGKRRVSADDWYFSCHFHEDPVMPGSLGVEAILQAMQLYVIECGLAADIPDAVFALARGVQLTWRYRGQILRTDRELHFEVSIKQVIREADRLVVIGDASLYKPGLRIYELIDIAIEVCPRPAAFGLASGASALLEQGRSL